MEGDAAFGYCHRTFEPPIVMRSAFSNKAGARHGSQIANTSEPRDRVNFWSQRQLNEIISADDHLLCYLERQSANSFLI